MWFSGGDMTLAESHVLLPMLPGVHAFVVHVGLIFRHRRFAVRLHRCISGLPSEPEGRLG